ncbi:MAG: gamma-glutamyl-gamma-aminobutyrate hydrolase family protein [Nitrospirae bacterium]|nr:gamma-glutamyl-gamma-aminobutyrate hydrolase family protein [Nitrospirota bacterium]
MDRPIIGITGDIKGSKFSVNMSYAYAIERAGAIPFFLPPSFSKNRIKYIATTINALLISGGGDINPVVYGEKQEVLLNLVSDNRINFEMVLLEKIMVFKKPVLGICYGIQLLNVFFGGSLYQELKKQKPDSLNHKAGHRIEIYSNSKLYYILGIKDVKVNSAHHQGIKELGKGLTVSARSEDRLIEAIELKNYPYFIGVQWHPERILDIPSHRLFKSFVASAI